MKDRNKRDTERRRFILEQTLKNLEYVKNDPESLFAISKQDQQNN